LAGAVPPAAFRISYPADRAELMDKILQDPTAEAKAPLNPSL